MVSVALLSHSVTRVTHCFSFHSVHASMLSTYSFFFYVKVDTMLRRVEFEEAGGLNDCSSFCVKLCEKQDIFSRFVLTEDNKLSAAFWSTPEHKELVLK